ncbi:hypothetical protein FGK63_20455 [Ruegeria sediminis]|uniref:Uncharacterized protein n=1 Tax=Ruegeria sediminis TaxID=2583820 RepID=A0ABY2WSW6_9RHOB|nr:hypothetical protein [Ruegeria sediminis]TMV02602.1 hypothetical protein FGK63_20455 [Ruegeria sediminis]
MLELRKALFVLCGLAVACLRQELYADERAADTGAAAKSIADIYDASTFEPSPFICSSDQSTNLTVFLEFQPGAEKVRLSIPRGYFDPRLKLRDNTTRRGQVLRIHGESFTPWPPELLPKRQEGPYVGMLLTDYIPIDDLAVHHASLVRGYTATNVPEFYAVESILGLETLVSDAPPYIDPETSAYSDTDLHISRNARGQITDVITCKKPGSVPYPGCQHYMDSPLVDFKIRYSLNLLPHWQDMSRNARAFVSCITSSPS